MEKRTQIESYKQNAATVADGKNWFKLAIQLNGQCWSWGRWREEIITYV